KGCGFVRGRGGVGFIPWANFSRGRAPLGGSPTAISLADFTISILSALSTVTVVPGGKPILTGDCAAALCETVKSLSSLILPSLTARSVAYVVMILVIEAGYHGEVAFSACNTLPLSTSTRMSDSEWAGRVASQVATPTLATRTIVRAVAE